MSHSLDGRAGAWSLQGSGLHLTRRRCVGRMSLGLAGAAWVAFLGSVDISA